MAVVPSLYLTRRFAFSAAHRLHSPALTGAEGAAAYGVCERVHGHNYQLEITVRGERDPRTGFFANVMDLKALVDRLVIDPCDHHFLNDVPLLAGAITTMEGIAERLWAVLAAPLSAAGMTLCELRLGETPEHWVTLRA